MDAHAVKGASGSAATSADAPGGGDLEARGQHRSAAVAADPTRSTPGRGRGTPVTSRVERRSGNELLLAARSDPNAFGVFYDQHARSILTFFARRVPDPETAADLCAETFAAALVAIAQFDPARGNAEQWLWGIALNQQVRYWRWRRADDRARELLAITTPPIDHEVRDLFERADSMSEAQDLALLFDVLPSQWREPVRLRVIEQLGYEAIAILLDCSRSAARVRVHRGLRQLARKHPAHDSI